MTTTEPQLSSKASTQRRPMLRGAVMIEAKKTIRELWGDGVYDAAVKRLTPDERQVIDGTLLASTFYPIAAWDHFLDAVYAEVKASTGETIEQFYAQLVRLGGGRLLRMLYKALLGIMRPTMVVKLIPAFWGRLYTSGKVACPLNERGRCVITFSDDSRAYRNNFANHVPPALTLMLSENGARNVQSVLTRNAFANGKLFIEVTTTYE